MTIGQAELLRACELARAGNWDAAHRIVQTDENDGISCWLHAVLHRIEGDEDNAAFWYREAGRPSGAFPDLARELDAIRAAILARGSAA